MIHVVLIATGKFTIDAIPGVTQNISWTAVNLSYLAVRPCPHDCNCGLTAFPVLVSHVSLGNGHPFWQRTTWRCL